jgi:membrane-anchored protein YejM (alkaline phosphatase superfamily)
VARRILGSDTPVDDRLAPVLLVVYCLALLLAAAIALAGLARLLAIVAPAIAWQLPLAIGAAALLLLSYGDIRAFVLLGVHLYSPVVQDAILRAQVGRELSFSPATVYGVLAIFGLLCLVEGALLAASTRYGRRYLAAGRARKIRFVALALLAAALVTLTFARRHVTGAKTGLSKALPLFELALAPRRRPHAFRIEYPTKPARMPLARTPNILLIVAESWRTDALGLGAMPALQAWTQAHGCLRSRRHYGGSHRTERSIFSLFYGLDAFHDAPFAAVKTPSLPLQALAGGGYRVVGASASSLSNWSGASFIVDQFAGYHEFAERQAWQDDADMIAWAKGFVGSSKSPWLLFLFFNSTHYGYVYPPDFERARPVATRLERLVDQESLPAFREGLRNRYRNAIAWLDHALVDALDALVKAGTIVVVTGDHGEELWETGQFGHTLPSFNEYRTRVPFFMCFPEGGGGEVPLSSHVDVMPTLFDYLGAGAALQGNTSGSSLLAPRPEDRLLIIPGGDFPMEDREICLLTSARKLWLRRDLDWLDRFVLTRTTNLDDIPQAAPDERALTALIARLNARLALHLKD